MNYVRVMADYNAHPLWDAEGVMMGLDELPVSEALRADLQGWQEWYDRDCRDYLDDPPPFPYAEFSARGLELAKRVKAELPDWTVVYWDEAAYRAWDAERGRFEYEVEP